MLQTMIAKFCFKYTSIYIYFLNLTAGDRNLCLKINKNKSLKNVKKKIN